MDFRIIDNISASDNHLTRLKYLFSQSDHVVITSPFLMKNISNFLGEIDLSGLKKIHLITTLKPGSSDQIRKVDSFVSLIEIPAIKENRIRCQISLNNRLHGKIYIFKKEGGYLAALVSSANFTDSGLSKNHEWGIEITEKSHIVELEASIFNSIQTNNLSFENIYLMRERIEDYLAKQPQSQEQIVDLDLTDILGYPNWLAELDETVTYWLKPIGATESPVEEGRPFTKTDDMLHFSKKKPSGVKPKDLLITYGVGTSKIISIYKVTSLPKHVTKEQMQETDWFERWPWYVLGHNLTPNFGGAWWMHNLHINTLKDQYLAINPNDLITAAGGTSLGGLNHGHDKLKLPTGFARYIIDQVVKMDNIR